MSEMNDEDLLAQLGLEVFAEKAGGRTAVEERVIAGFEDILHFVETQGRIPVHGEGRDIFERLYAVRLDRLRAMESVHALLAPLDRFGLLATSADGPTEASEVSLDDEDLLAALGEAGEDDITQLRHVRSYDDRMAAEEMANRTRCDDFDRFKPLFERAEWELKSGDRKTLRFGRDGSVVVGDFFILAGQIAYVAEVGEVVRTPNGEANPRLRVIFSNGTESNLLQRSLQRALYKDDTGRRIISVEAGPLFGDVMEPDDIEHGTIYVLRSDSTVPFVAEHRELIHKIGITGGRIEARVANAENDPTYLMAKVEVVATYRLSNLNRTKLEKLFHRLFSVVQLEVEIPDRFGKAVRPREWFVVPLSAIDEAVTGIRDGSIADMVYDPREARLRPARG
ncbi:GIY-YIG nuclease family protein [Luteibacter yeojuensis]|uniref:GIY-YIG nuclease family protein n=1 Tax=Luteibacter yeojuensis TaxID=345309 RepID=A0A7X5TPI1_9GAMM|nr:GIY-YIG nuclease family protein [Luteibacter yeojuensis]NID14492.1 GIY-YIG nuclease family protein [Luteibacter yeojuensis]